MVLLPLWCLIIRNLSRFFSLVSGISDDIKAVHDNLSGTMVLKDTDLRKVPIRINLIRGFILTFAIIMIYSRFTITANTKSEEITSIAFYLIVSGFAFYMTYRK